MHIHCSKIFIWQRHYLIFSSECVVRNQSPATGDSNSEQGVSTAAAGGLWEQGADYPITEWSQWEGEIVGDKSLQTRGWDLKNGDTLERT